MYELIDAIPAWAIVVGASCVLGIVALLGRRLGQSRPDRDGDAHGPYAGTIVAALLALLGLLLAFAFSAVESRFAARKQLVLDEANAISTTFLRAGFLDADERDTVRESLREYVAIRVAPRVPSELAPALHRSEVIHEGLWKQAEEAAARHPRSQAVSLFVQSLNELIDLHEDRVTVAIHQRLPTTILVVLGILACLSLGVLGYAGGLARSRARFPSAAITVAVASVMMMIIELDRPFGHLFRVSQDAMHDVEEQISGFPASAAAAEGARSPQRLGRAEHTKSVP